MGEGLKVYRNNARGGKLYTISSVDRAYITLDLTKNYLIFFCASNRMSYPIPQTIVTVKKGVVTILGMRSNATVSVNLLDDGRLYWYSSGGLDGTFRAIEFDGEDSISRETIDGQNSFTLP